MSGEMALAHACLMTYLLTCSKEISPQNLVKLRLYNQKFDAVVIFGLHCIFGASNIPLCSLRLSVCLYLLPDPQPREGGMC